MLQKSLVLNPLAQDAISNLRSYWQREGYIDRVRSLHTRQDSSKVAEDSNNSFPSHESLTCSVASDTISRARTAWNIHRGRAWR